MGKQLYLNNFDTLIIAAVKSSPSTGSPNTELDYGILRVAAGAAGALGTLSNGDYYILTAYKKSGTVESNREIWRVTYIDTSVINETRLTVSRAQEGTTAQSFVAGDYVSMRLTTGGLSNLLQRGGDTLSGALNGAPAVTIASGTTTDIGAAGSNEVTISGTTTITGLGSIAGGARRWVTFSGALVITHNATSLILPGAANITTVAGDCAEFVSLGSGNWKCTGYTKATVTGTGAAVFADSPALAGTPTAPTAAAGTNTTQLATTAHVVAERSASRALTNLTGLTVVSGGASISGNVSVTGSVSATGASSNNQLILERTGSATGKWGIYTHSNSLFFSDNVASADRMVIDSSGNLLVGVASNSYSTISATKPNNWAFGLYNYSSTTPYGMYIFTAATGGVGGDFLYCTDASASRFRVLGSGNCQNQNNSYGAISDPALKTNISLAKSQWDDVKRLARNVVKYNFKSDPNGFKQIGFLSRDHDGITGVRSISPGLVQANPEIEEYEVEPATEAQAEILDGEGNVLSPFIAAKPAVMGRRETGKSTDSVQYSIANMKAFKALGEALERIEALEAKEQMQDQTIAALMARLAALEAHV